ncbi:MAG TPA: metalloregulator ArsR/SmtB family transcription factor [Myxococcaceae bacterium]|nr:metalloregulator ArsR/SmtB family transcription factor [Myxococcaceae bacterium]
MSPELLLPALRGLAEPTRLRIVALLSGWIGPRQGPLRCDEPGLCLTDLELAVGLPHPLVSHHVRTLCEAGLVESERRGRWTIYRIRPERLRPLGRVLLRMAAGQGVADTPEAAELDEWSIAV